MRQHSQGKHQPIRVQLELLLQADGRRSYLGCSCTARRHSTRHGRCTGRPGRRTGCHRQSATPTPTTTPLGHTVRGSIQLRPLYRLANMAHQGTDHNEPGAEQRHAGESPRVPQHLVPLSVPRPLEAFGDGEWPEKEQEPLPENTLLTGHRHFRRTHIKHGGRKRRRRTKAVIP